MIERRCNKCVVKGLARRHKLANLRTVCLRKENQKEVFTEDFFWLRNTGSRTTRGPKVKRLQIGN